MGLFEKLWVKTRRVLESSETFSFWAHPRTNVLGVFKPRKPVCLLRANLKNALCLHSWRLSETECFWRATKRAQMGFLSVKNLWFPL